LRILDAKGIDSEYWLRQKILKFIKFKPEEQQIPFRAIVNANNLDPDLKVIKEQASDPWNAIRQYLELPDNCQFPDGYIPKGWMPAGDDTNDKGNIVSITGDGFYRYNDGSQWRGRRHYAANKYYTIKCDFSNFSQFQPDWMDSRFISRKPTWEEYSKWALYPNIWNEQGESLCNCKPVKWRKS
jgi:hypothetical protein